MSGYADIIAGITTEHDPRHIEAYMRLEYGTLDHLDIDTFKREVEIASACIQQAGIDASEDLARSYGL